MSQAGKAVTDGLGSGRLTVRPLARITRLVRAYPVTVAIALPYAILILPGAIVNDNPAIWFILGTFMIAFLTTFFVETLSLVVDRGKASSELIAPAYRTRATAVFRVGLWVMFVGLAAGISTALMGVGTIDAAIGRSTVTSSPIVTLLGLLGSWEVVGIGLITWACAGALVSRKKYFVYVLVAIGLKFVHVMILGITVQLWRFLICVFFLLIYFQLIRLRVVMIAMMIAIIAWPLFFEARNEIRSDRGVTVATNVNATDRLRYDLQIAKAQGIEPGVDLGQPDSLIEILRYGALPRFLDSNRAEVSTGRLINQYLGGTSTSAFTFLPITTSYVLGNWYGTVMLYAFWTIFTAILLRHGRGVTPHRVVIFSLLLVGPLNWFTIFPDSAIGFVQDIVSTIPVFFVLLLVRSQRGALRIDKKNTRGRT